MCIAGCLTGSLILEYAPAARWARKRNDVLKLSEDVLRHVEAVSEECGLEDLMNQATYPPNGALRFNESTAEFRNCATFDEVYDAAKQVNPCFDICEFHAGSHE